MRKLRLKRKAAGLTMKQLAEKIGKTEACISFYENGKTTPPVPVARQIAKAVGCEWPELYEEDTKND